MVQTIAATTNKSGLATKAARYTNTYPTGTLITDRQMKVFQATRLHRHEIHGDWNFPVAAGTGWENNTLK